MAGVKCSLSAIGNDQTSVLLQPYKAAAGTALTVPKVILEGCLLTAFPVEANVRTCPKVAEAERMMVSRSPSVKDGGGEMEGRGAAGSSQVEKDREDEVKVRIPWT